MCLPLYSTWLADVALGRFALRRESRNINLSRSLLLLSHLPSINKRVNRKRGTSTLSASDFRSGHEYSKQSHARSNWPLYPVSQGSECARKKTAPNCEWVETALTKPVLSEKGLSVSFLSFPAFRRSCQGVFYGFSLSKSVAVLRRSKKEGLSENVGCHCCQDVSDIMWPLLGFTVHVLYRVRTT